MITDNLVNFKSYYVPSKAGLCRHAKETSSDSS